MTWDEWIAQNRHALTRDGTPFELDYVNTVLRKVPRLPPTSVFAQTEFEDLSGRVRFIDFTIKEGDFVRIAIEVDGYDKTGRKAGMSRSEFHDWSFKELSITAEGWLPLRVANGLIKREPEALIESVARQLEEQRWVESELRNGGETAELAKTERAHLRSEAEAARRKAISAQGISDTDREKLRAILVRKEELDDQLLDEKRRRERAEKEIKSMKVLGIAFAAVVIAIVVGIVLVGLPGSGGSTPSLCDDAIPADQLSSDDVGRTLTARGEVAGVKRLDYDPPVVLLNLGDEYPDQDLAIVIKGNNINNFKIPPEDKYDKREVAVNGRAFLYGKESLEIAANSPNDVVICP